MSVYGVLIVLVLYGFIFYKINKSRQEGAFRGLPAAIKEAKWLNLGILIVALVFGVNAFCGDIIPKNIVTIILLGFSLTNIVSIIRRTND